MAFVGQPVDVIVGEVITDKNGDPLIVEVLNNLGERVEEGTHDVVVSINDDPSGSASLNGTLTKASANGLAEFTDLKLDSPGDGFTLLANADGLDTDVSDEFQVFKEPSNLVFSVQPDDQNTNREILGSSGNPLEVHIRNDDDLTVPVDRDVNIQIANDPTGGRANLVGTTTVQAQDGVAKFDDLEIDSSGKGYTLLAFASGVTDAESNAFDIIGTEHFYLEGQREDEWLPIVPDGSPTHQKNDDHLYLLAENSNGTEEGTWRFEALVDMGLFGKIEIEWENTGSTATENESYFIISTQTGDHTVFDERVAKTGQFSRTVDEIDVSGLAGDHYIRFHARTPSSVDDFISEIRTFRVTGKLTQFSEDILSPEGGSAPIGESLETLEWEEN